MDTITFYSYKGGESLDEQLNVSDILVLHSDRSLELSESLRLSLENITDKPLAKDYLQLFSKNIPGKLIETKISSMLEDTISPEALFENPDKIQKELEALAFIYPHPKSFEKLIDFYFLRNKSIGEKLRLFLDLWEVSKQFSRGMFSKFIQTFLEMELDYWRISKEIFIEIAGIAKEYLRVNPNSSNSDEVVLKLADIYKNLSDNKIALVYYLKVLDKVEKKSEVLKSVFEIYKEQKKYKEEILNQKLLSKLTHSLSDRSEYELINLGKIFYKLNKFKIFKENIPDDFPGKQYILSSITREIF
ncbi:MAG: hypothetical protein PVH61_00620 [Candidatus Aminicenantes bacterium]|jgi:hypothetical protein